MTMIVKRVLENSSQWERNKRVKDRKTGKRDEEKSNSEKY